MPDQRESILAPIPRIDPAVWEEGEGFRVTLLLHFTDPEARPGRPLGISAAGNTHVLRLHSGCWGASKSDCSFRPWDRPLTPRLVPEGRPAARPSLPGALRATLSAGLSPPRVRGRHERSQE